MTISSAEECAISSRQIKVSIHGQVQVSSVGMEKVEETLS